MGAKSRSKKRVAKPELSKTSSKNEKFISDNGDIDEFNVLSNEDCKIISKDLPFSSISNKQFKSLGLVPDKKPTKNIVTVPLRFPGKLMPVLRKIFNFSKNRIKNESTHVTNSITNIENNYITLISFQNYIQNGQQIKHLNHNIPTLQVTRMPISNSKGDMTLYLSETNIKPEAIPNKSPIPLPSPKLAIDLPKSSSVKVTKKRSFFNDIWKKKSTPASDPLSVSISEISKPTEAHVSINAPSEHSTSVESVFSNICIICKQQAFIAERIQIGADVFHGNCFKCSQCSKCLYRGKWNKNQDQYLCDNCNKKQAWSFVRR